MFRVVGVRAEAFVLKKAQGLGFQLSSGRPWGKRTLRKNRTLKGFVVHFIGSLGYLDPG